MWGGLKLISLGVFPASREVRIPKFGAHLHLVNNAAGASITDSGGQKGASLAYDVCSGAGNVAKKLDISRHRVFILREYFSKENAPKRDRDRQLYQPWLPVLLREGQDFPRAPEQLRGSEAIRMRTSARRPKADFTHRLCELVPLRAGATD